MLQALALEIKRLEAEKVHPSFFTSKDRDEASSIDDGADDDIVDGRDGDSDINEDAPVKLLKRPQKVTKAKRNKAKLQSLRAAEAAKSKAEKRMNRDIVSVKALVKQVNSEELSKQIKAKNRKKEKETKIELMRNVSNHFDAVSVPLSDELSGSLRTLTTRVCPLRAQVATLVSDGKAVAKNSRKKRAFEKPHAGKKVKWVARYKY
jgi:hypothetical protein